MVGQTVSQKLQFYFYFNLISLQYGLVLCYDLYLL
jgi:hypothetical protein